MLDIIGTIYTPGEYDSEDNVITAPVALSGYHVNSPQAIEGWEQYRITPETPMRVFAGHETFFYSFVDEAEFTAKAIEVGLLPAPELETPPTRLARPT